MKPLVLTTLSGWGVAPDSDNNAITRAKTPNYDRFLRQYPAMTLYASGAEVGLSVGEESNSQVSHLNIGAGRVCYKLLPRINKNIADGSFFDNPAFMGAAEHIRENNSVLHLVGLLSSANIHASGRHLQALLEFAKKRKIQNVYLHIILDGIDVPEQSGLKLIEKLQKKIKELKCGKIATISGRFYAMDRDGHWDRTKKAYEAMVLGKADEYYGDAVQAIKTSYEKGIFDANFAPVVVGEDEQCLIKEGDAVIFFNFKTDRVRQLAESFVLPAFPNFTRDYLKEVFFVTMTEYEKEIPVEVAFSPLTIHNSLAEVLSKAELTQLHIVESEKNAEVNYFFNGLRDEVLAGEDRIIIPSVKAAYEESPGMSAGQIAKEVARVINQDKHNVVIANFANAELVAKTDNLVAATKACEAIDKALGKIYDHLKVKDGVLVVVGDAGGAEAVGAEEKNNNPVPFLIIGSDYRGIAGPAGDPPEGDLSLSTPVGKLADVAPTILEILGIDKPAEMDGKPLV